MSLTNQMNVNIFVISADPRNAPENPFPRSSSLIQNLGPLKKIANFSTSIPSKSYVLVKWEISISLGTIFFSWKYSLGLWTKSDSSSGTSNH